MSGAKGAVAACCVVRAASGAGVEDPAFLIREVYIVEHDAKAEGIARTDAHAMLRKARSRRGCSWRKNFLFLGHEEAGDNFAGLYSLTATCEANAVEPSRI